MKRLVGILLLTLMLAPLHAAGGGFAARSGSHAQSHFQSHSGWSARPSPGHSVLRPSTRHARRAARQLERFGERRRFEARVRMLNTSRDAERRRAEDRLRRSARPGDFASYRRRIRAEDDLDDLSLRSELRRLEAAGRRVDAVRWWRSLGPATARAMLRNGLDLRRLLRDHERELRLSALEDAATRERREAFAVLDDPFGPREQP